MNDCGRRMRSVTFTVLLLFEIAEVLTRLWEILFCSVFVSCFTFMTSILSDAFKQREMNENEGGGEPNGFSLPKVSASSPQLSNGPEKAIGE